MIYALRKNESNVMVKMHLQWKDVNRSFLLRVSATAAWQSWYPWTQNICFPGVGHNKHFCIIKPYEASSSPVNCGTNVRLKYDIIMWRVNGTGNFKYIIDWKTTICNIVILLTRKGLRTEPCGTSEIGKITVIPLTRIKALFEKWENEWLLLVF
jgi:hypothetical protein